MAFFGGHPRRKRSRNVLSLMPDFSDHCAIVSVSPSMAIRRLVLMLLDCCLLEAHEQFAGLYSPSLSIRSRVLPSGFSPMSARKFINSDHRAQIVMPRPPYRFHSGWLGLKQRARMLDQQL